MRKFINTLAFALTISTGTAMAYNIPYENQVPNYPPEHDVEAYPKAIPCVWQRFHDPSRKDITKALNCTIIAWPREVSYTDSKGTPHVGPNWQEGYCSNGSCINSVTGDVFASVPGTILAQTELMYYIQGSGEKIVAHRSGEGPMFGKPEITYAQAGHELRNFYTRGGANASAVDTLFKRRTGLTWQEWQEKNLLEDKLSSVSAWCNPLKENDCYINDQWVDQSRLKEHLPVMSGEEAESRNGFCEPIICFIDDNAVGINSNFRYSR